MCKRLTIVDGAFGHLDWMTPLWLSPLHEVQKVHRLPRWDRAEGDDDLQLWEEFLRALDGGMVSPTVLPMSRLRPWAQGRSTRQVSDLPPNLVEHDGHSDVPGKLHETDQHHRPHVEAGVIH